MKPVQTVNDIGLPHLKPQLTGSLLLQIVCLVDDEVIVRRKDLPSRSQVG